MVDEGLALCVCMCVLQKRNNVLAQMVYNAKKETEFSVITLLECSRVADGAPPPLDEFSLASFETSK